MALPHIVWYAVAPSLSNDKPGRQETIARIKCEYILSSSGIL